MCKTKYIMVGNKTRISRVDVRNVKVEIYKTIIDKTTKEEKQSWMFQGYYSSLDSALRTILKFKLCDVLEDVDTINQILEHIKVLETMTEHNIRELVKEIEI